MTTLYNQSYRFYSPVYSPVWPSRWTENHAHDDIHLPGHPRGARRARVAGPHGKLVAPTGGRPPRSRPRASARGLSGPSDRRGGTPIRVELGPLSLHAARAPMPGAHGRIHHPSRAAALADLGGTRPEVPGADRDPPIHRHGRAVPDDLDGRARASFRERAAYLWMGFSTGEWVGDKLRVRTTHIKQGWHRRNGLPSSDRMELI